MHIKVVLLNKHDDLSNTRNDKTCNVLIWYVGNFVFLSNRNIPL